MRRCENVAMLFQKLMKRTFGYRRMIYAENFGKPINTTKENTANSQQK
jgi:hypothetical protein